MTQFATDPDVGEFLTRIKGGSAPTPVQPASDPDEGEFLSRIKSAPMGPPPPIPRVEATIYDDNRGTAPARPPNPRWDATYAATEQALNRESSTVSPLQPGGPGTAPIEALEPNVMRETPEWGRGMSAADKLIAGATRGYVEAMPAGLVPGGNETKERMSMQQRPDGAAARIGEFAGGLPSMVVPSTDPLHNLMLVSMGLGGSVIQALPAPARNGFTALVKTAQKYAGDRAAAAIEHAAEAGGFSAVDAMIRHASEENWTDPIGAVGRTLGAGAYAFGQGAATFGPLGALRGRGAITDSLPPNVARAKAATAQKMAMFKQALQQSEDQKLHDLARMVLDDPHIPRDAKHEVVNHIMDELEARRNAKAAPQQPTVTGVTQPPTSQAPMAKLPSGHQTPVTSVTPGSTTPPAPAPTPAPTPTSTPAAPSITPTTAAQTPPATPTAAPRPPTIAPMAGNLPRTQTTPKGEAAQPSESSEAENKPRAWYRGENDRQAPGGDTFYSADQSVAGEFGGGKSGELDPTAAPKNPLRVNSKEELADQIGYTGDPRAEAFDTPPDQRFDNLAKKYAQSKGHDAIEYETGTFDAPELHVFKSSPAPASDLVGGFTTEKPRPDPSKLSFADLKQAATEAGIDPSVGRAEMVRQLKEKAAPESGGDTWHHGSHTDFDEIRPSGNKPPERRSRGWDGVGVWMSGSEKGAGMYGPKVSQWNAKPKNPLELVGGGHRPWDLLADPEILSDYLSGDELDEVQKHGPRRKAILDQLHNVTPQGIASGKVRLNDKGQTYPEAIGESLKAKGYDAVVWRGSKLDMPKDGSETHDVMLLLDPSLAKKKGSSNAVPIQGSAKVGPHPDGQEGARPVEGAGVRQRDPGAVQQPPRAVAQPEEEGPPLRKAGEEKAQQPDGSGPVSEGLKPPAKMRKPELLAELDAAGVELEGAAEMPHRDLVKAVEQVREGAVETEKKPNFRSGDSVEWDEQGKVVAGQVLAYLGPATNKGKDDSLIQVRSSDGKAVNIAGSKLRVAKSEKSPVSDTSGEAKPASGPVKAGEVAEKSGDLAKQPWEMTQTELGGKIQLIAKSAGKEVGEIAITPRNDGNYEVSNLLVWPERRRQGAATELYRMASKEAAARGKKLFVSEDITPDAAAVHKTLMGRGLITPEREVLADYPDLKPQPKPDAGGKQPWEMTREEWIGDGRVGRIRFGDVDQETITSPQFDTPVEASEWARSRGIKNPGIQSSGRRGGKKLYMATGNTSWHENAVWEALKAGKPVPPEVLADYPDLKPKESERPTRPDGRLIPQLGDEVYQVVPGFGGMPSYIYGKVFRGKGGTQRVITTGSAAMIGGSPTGKTYPLDANWTVKGDPEITRREAAREQRDRDSKAAFEKSRKDTAAAIEASVQKSIAAGEKPVDADTPLGAVLTQHGPTETESVVLVRNDRLGAFTAPAETPGVGGRGVSREHLTDTGKRIDLAAAERKQAVEDATKLPDDEIREMAERVGDKPPSGNPDSAWDSRWADVVRAEAKKRGIATSEPQTREAILRRMAEASEKYENLDTKLRGMAWKKPKEVAGKGIDEKTQNFNIEIGQIKKQMAEVQKEKDAARLALVEFDRKGDATPKVAPATPNVAGTDTAIRKQIRDLEAKKYKSNADEIALRIAEARLDADPSKWKPGDGVGYYAGPATSKALGSQINRGFQIVEVDAADKQVKVRQVADTGLTTSGGDSDRMAAEWIGIEMLVRDRKYDRAEAAPAKETPAIATGLPILTAEEYRSTKGSKPWQMMEREYLKHSTDRQVRNYERGIADQRAELAKLGPKATTSRQKIENTIAVWESMLKRYQDKRAALDTDKTIDASTDYAKLIKDAISKGEAVPQAIIDQRPEFQKAQDGRARYDKGRHTSFANKSIAVDSSMQEKRGYKAKRQDGTTLTEAQRTEIDKAVADVEEAVGPLADLMRKTDLTIAHTNGKFPFMMSDAGGLYHPSDRTVTIGTIIGPFIQRAAAHELGHWLDFEAGRARNLKTRIVSKSGKGSDSLSTAEAAYRGYGHGATDAELSAERKLIRAATDAIQGEMEIRKILRTKPEEMTEEQKTRLAIIKFTLTPYFREPREVWARLFEQYVANKIGRGGPGHNSPKSYAEQLGYWTPEEFEKLRPEIERIIASKLAVMRGGEEAKPAEPQPSKKTPAKSGEYTRGDRVFVRHTSDGAFSEKPYEVVATDPVLVVREANADPRVAQTFATNKDLVKRAPAEAKPSAAELRDETKKTLGHKPGLGSVDTIAGNMNLDEFEASGYAPEEVTRADWVALQRANRKALGQNEDSGTSYAPNADYEEYHRDAVKKAIARGEEVDEEVLKDYPDLVAKKPPGAESVQAEREASNTVEFAQRHRLRSPITGKTGAKIVAYRWMSQMEDGMYGDRRVSDWSQAQTSVPTGRQIVHLFLVQTPDGKETMMGVGAAQKALGFDEAKLYSIAKREADAQRESIAQWDRSEKKIEADAPSSMAEANRAYRLANSPSKMMWGTPEQHEAKASELFDKATLLRKGDKYIRTGDEDTISNLESRGWSRVEAEKETAAEREYWQMTRAEFAETDIGQKRSFQSPPPEETRKAIAQAISDVRAAMHERVDPRLGRVFTVSPKLSGPSSGKWTTSERNDVAGNLKAADLLFDESSDSDSFTRVRLPSRPIDIHRNSIQTAIREGKTVAEEVLKDYPDLAKPTEEPKSEQPEPPAAPIRPASEIVPEVKRLQREIDDATFEAQKHDKDVEVAVNASRRAIHNGNEGAFQRAKEQEKLSMRLRGEAHDKLEALKAELRKIRSENDVVRKANGMVEPLDDAIRRSMMPEEPTSEQSEPTAAPEVQEGSPSESREEQRSAAGESVAPAKPEEKPDLLYEYHDDRAATPLDVASLNPRKPADAERIVKAWQQWHRMESTRNLDPAHAEAASIAFSTLVKPVEHAGPTDTKVYALPGKETELAELAKKSSKVKPDAVQTVDQAARLGGFKAPPISYPAGNPSHTVKPVKDIGGRIKSVGAARAKENSRYAINGVYAEKPAKSGQRLVTTDGRRMFMLKLPKGEMVKPGLYLIDENPVLDTGKGTLAKVNEDPEKNFPPYEEVLPDYATAPAMATVDAARTLRAVRRAAMLTSEESRGVAVVKNPDGSLGFATMNQERGAAMVNVQDGYEYIVHMNPGFVADALEFILANGGSHAYWRWGKPNKPVVISGDPHSQTGVVDTVTMPVNGGDWTVEDVEMAGESIPLDDVVRTSKRLNSIAEHNPGRLYNSTLQIASDPSVTDLYLKHPGLDSRVKNAIREQAKAAKITAERLAAEADKAAINVAYARHEKFIRDMLMSTPQTSEEGLKWVRDKLGAADDQTIRDLRMLLPAKVGMAGLEPYISAEFNKRGFGPKMESKESVPSSPEADAILKKIGEYQGGAHSPDMVRMHQELGSLVVPGVRLANAEEAGRLYVMVKNQRASADEWASYVADLKASNKISSEGSRPSRGGFVVLPDAETQIKIRGAVRSLRALTLPRTSQIAGEPVIASMTTLAATPTVAKAEADRINSKIGILKNPKLDTKAGAVFTEDRLRGIKKREEDAALAATDPDEIKQHQDNAAAVRTLVGPGQYFPDEAAYQAAKASPEVVNIINAVGKEFVPVNEALFKRAQNLDPAKAPPSGGGLEIQQHVSLAAIRPEDSVPGRFKAMGTAYPQSQSGGRLKEKKSRFGRQATGAASLGYDIRLSKMIERSLEGNMKAAHLKLMYDELEAAGIGKRSKIATAPKDIAGLPTAQFRIKDGGLLLIPEEGDPQLVPQTMVFSVPRVLVDEIEAVANAKGKISMGVIDRLNRKITGINLVVGVADAVSHNTNLMSRLLNAPGVGANLVERIAGHVGPVRLLTALHAAATKWAQVSRQDQKVLDQIAELAKLGVLRDIPEGWTRNPINWVGKGLIERADLATRLALDDAWHFLRDLKLQEDTQEARRRFILQVGQYNRGLSSQFVRFLKDSQLGPFATAGFTFNREAVRTIAGQYGGKARSLPASIAMRGMAFGPWIGTFVAAVILNALIWGDPTPKGMPPGSIKIGETEDKKPRYWDPMAIWGVRRGLRALGLQTAAQQIANDQKPEWAPREAINQWLSPAVGPVPRVASTLALGQEPFLNPDGISLRRTADVVPPGPNRGWRQALENAKTAGVTVVGQMAPAKDAEGGMGSKIKAVGESTFRQYLPQTGQNEQRVKEMPRIIDFASLNDYIDDQASKIRRLKTAGERNAALKKAADEIPKAGLRGRFMREMLFKKRVLAGQR